MKRFALLALVACGSTPHPARRDRHVITAQRVYIAPDQPPLDDAWVEVAGNQIVAVGTGAPPDVPRDTTCSGGVITAGFHNSHVHFTNEAFRAAAEKSPAQLEPAVQALATQWGFTTVTDAGSNPLDTRALRDRISRGELRGPRILMAGIGLYADIPFYLRDLPPEVLAHMPQPRTPEAARADVQRNFALGADGTKLFIATPQGHGVTHRMEPEVARAAVDETHRAGKLVMVHPTDVEGVTAAMAAGVDMIIHTTIDPDPSVWPPALIAQLVAKHIAIAPTLKLWRYELAKRSAPEDEIARNVGDAQAQLKAFVAAGGQVLFGTDAGYMTDLDPTDEYVLMAQAGMTPMQILASLTTNPAARWRAHRGKVAASFPADLVVLEGDPAADVKQFSAVKCVFRDGTRQFAR